MFDQFAGTRAERQWLALLRRIAEALKRIAAQMEEESR